MDLLTGGTGADEFHFDTISSGSLDTITDFAVGEDMLVFSASLEARSRLFEITDTADGALVSFGPSSQNSIDIALLQGVSAADLTVDDFAFV